MSDVAGAATFGTPAEAYDRHVGRYSRELARALIAAAGVRPGRRALDVGCGPGALTTELVAVLGAANVAAVDPSVSFADAYGRRLPGVHVEVASAEALPFADEVILDDVVARLAARSQVPDDPRDGRACGRVRASRAGSLSGRSRRSGSG